MSDLTANKIFFSILATGLVIVGLNSVSGAFFHTGEGHGHEEAEAAGGVKDCSVFKEYCVAPEGGAGGAAPAEEEKGPIDWGVVLASADIQAGKDVAVKCQQCHHFGKGEGALQGPDLYAVVGRDIASVGDFKYSTGDNSLSALDGVWDYEHLNHFLEGPKRYVTGTAMNFVGIRKEKDRINLIAYLRSNADTPYPLPDPLPPKAEEPTEMAAAEDGAAPAEGVAAEGGDAPAQETAPEGATEAPAPAEH
ncbi:MAG: cytochrome C class I [Hyphomonadaceae bacterium]